MSGGVAAVEPSGRGRIAGIPLEVSRLIQGTLLMTELAEERAFELFDELYAAGCNAFDTAIVYGAGRAEQLLGGWARRRGIRSSVVIVDKGCHPAGAVARMTPEALRHDVQRSLHNLGTDYIDLYLLHRDDERVPVGEIVSALAEEQSAGYIRSYGGSNWTHGRLQQANDYAAQDGIPPFAASSPALSLVVPVRSWPGCVSVAHDREALGWYRASRMPLLAWSPLASGFLGGHLQREDMKERSREELRALDFYASETNWARLERLKVLARHKGVSPAVLAVAYVLQAPLDVYAVLGCREASEYDDALAAAALRLSEEDVAFLERDEMA